ncbi:MAG: hypothetical protein GY953_15290, partial [bacterium]|nr:hypothetical protein [bacterium]
RRAKAALQRVVAAEGRLQPVEPSRVGALAEVVKLPAREHTPEELTKAKEVAPKFGERNAAPFLDLVKAFRVLEVAGRDSRPLDAEVQVISIGNDLAWVGLPGEIFVEIGLDIKKRSPFPRTIVIELANGSVGYVPDRRAYPQGAYEAVSARCGPGSGEMLADAAVRMLEKLHQVAVRK